VTAPPSRAQAIRAQGQRVDRRLPGPDVVRAVALIGVVVMNFHGYLIIRSERGDDAVGTGWAAELFDPWDGPLTTRFAATFVLVAGVGVTLMTRRAVEQRAIRHAVDAERTADDGASDGDGGNGALTALRLRLVRRGLLLYVVGLLLEEIWPGTIIVYYGAMFVLAAAMITWRSRWIALVGITGALTGAGISAWQYERNLDFSSTSWLTDPDVGSLRDHVFGLFVNGTHPLLPWFAFLCAGMLLGRLLSHPNWRRVTIGTGITLVGVAALASTRATTPLQEHLLSIHPFDRGVVYTASALGTALLAYATIDWIAERFPEATDPLRRAGQMTLTLYLAHDLVFNLVVDWLGCIEPAGRDVALAFALGFWVVGITAAVTWQRRHGIGPAERVYRAVGG
jgi:uncharacterized membrane protein YeiB